MDKKKKVKAVNPLKACPSLSTSLMFQTNKANEIAFARCEQWAKEHYGIGLRSVWIMICCDGGTMSQRRCADVLGINYNVMVNEIDELEKKHLIKRMQNPKNRREHALRLTPSGTKLLGVILEAQKQGDIYRHAFAPIPLENMPTILAAARSVIDHETE